MYICLLMQVFLDLSSDMSYQDSSTPLHVCEDEVLGKGGFGFVCKGELRLSADNVRSLVISLTEVWYIVVLIEVEVSVGM